MRSQGTLKNKLKYSSRRDAFCILNDTLKVAKQSTKNGSPLTGATRFSLIAYFIGQLKDSNVAAGVVPLLVVFAAFLFVQTAVSPFTARN